jgi:hypothetical protein
VSNARSLARVLVDRYGVTGDTPASALCAPLRRYAEAEVLARGGSVSAFRADIDAIAETVSDSYETHLQGYVREYLEQRQGQGQGQGQQG